EEVDRLLVGPEERPDLGNALKVTATCRLVAHVRLQGPVRSVFDDRRGGVRDQRLAAEEGAYGTLAPPLVDQVGLGAVMRVVLLGVEAVVPVSSRHRHPSKP